MIILLPGNGSHNKEWIESVRDAIGGEILVYEHWKTGEKVIDFEKETKRLAEMAQDEEVEIFAKSAGCLLAIKAVHEGGIRVRKAVFVGAAVRWGEELGLPVSEWLKDWTFPTLFIQAVGDPAIPGEELRPLLPLAGLLKVVPGEDHDYADLVEYIGDVRAFLDWR